MSPESAESQFRLHLRIQESGSGVLIVNASTVLHLNQTATEYAKMMIENLTVEDAAAEISRRYRVGSGKAKRDYSEFKDHILALATNPDIDPVQYLGMDRTDPFVQRPPVPYRLDCALTYRLDEAGNTDPLAARRVEKELTTDEWKKILSDAWEAGIPHVTFTGGEPTLRADLLDLIRHAEGLGQVTGLLTSGVRFSEAGYVEQLSLTGIDHFLVCLDPADPAQFQTLKTALDSDVFTAVHITLKPENYQAVRTTLERLHEIGVPAVSFSVSETSDQLLLEMQAARAHAAYLGMRLIWDIPAPYSVNNPISAEVEAPAQGAGTAWMYVEPDGDVLPSQGVNQVLGNLSRDPWDEILEKARDIFDG
jgi:organic radical activating enzyme